MHGKHRSGKSFALLVDVVCALNDLAVQDLVGVDVVRHLAAEDSAVRDHLARHLALQAFDALHAFVHLDLFSLFVDLGELLGVFDGEPLDKVLAALEFLGPHDGLHEPREVLLPPLYALITFLLLLKWQWWYDQVWVLLQKDFTELVEVLILALNLPADGLNCNCKKQVVGGEDAT